MAETSLGLDENVEGALSYLLGFLTGILFFVLERDNDFVSFHAAQSTVVFVALFVINLVLGVATTTLVLASPVLGSVVGGLLSLVSTLVSLAGFALWILLMVKAYQGERYSLPVAGSYAERLAG